MVPGVGRKDARRDWWARSVFGISRPSAYVEGEFVAAMKTPAGWVTVRPRPEGFPNSWQRRVLLWFALSLALVVPPAYLLARRLVTPLQQFAETAIDDIAGGPAGGGSTQSGLQPIQKAAARASASAGFDARASAHDVPATSMMISTPR